MSTVLVTGPTVLQNLPFSSVVAVTVASNHFPYPGWDDQAELAWVAVCLSVIFEQSNEVTLR